jgi:hypothetical protein
MDWTRVQIVGVDEKGIKQSEQSGYRVAVKFDRKPPIDWSRNLLALLNDRWAGQKIDLYVEGDRLLIDKTTLAHVETRLWPDLVELAAQCDGEYADMLAKRKPEPPPRRRTTDLPKAHKRIFESRKPR